jgi:hypothetical protein
MEAANKVLEKLKFMRMVFSEIEHPGQRVPLGGIGYQT